MNRRFIQYIVIIAAILIIVTLSQQPFMKPFGIFAYNWGEDRTAAYWSRATNWFWAGLHPAVEKEIVEKGGALKEEAAAQKDNAAKNIWGNIKKYLAEKFSKISGTDVE